MNAYEQAVSVCNVACAEIERINDSIYNVQQAYNQLNGVTPDDDKALHHWEEQKARLAHQTIKLVRERNRWQEIRCGAEQTIQQAHAPSFELASDDVPFQAMQIEPMNMAEAHTPEEVQAVLMQDAHHADQASNQRRTHYAQD